MANTIAQLDIENWIVQQELPRIFGIKFGKKNIPLKWGGTFEFDAVSDSEAIAICISTSKYKTASGKAGIAKIMKLKADALYLTNILRPTRTIMVFTETCMVERIKREVENGRFPPEVELIQVTPPESLQVSLKTARDMASKETTPSHRVFRG